MKFSAAIGSVRASIEARPNAAAVEISASDQFAPDLYGAFAVKGLFSCG
jgi:hypothetical protein